MKLYFYLSVFLIIGACAETRYTTKIENLKASIKIEDSTLVDHYANTITAEELKINLYQFSSVEFEGRETGKLGQKRAVEFIRSFYKRSGIKSPIKDSVYFQTIPKSFLPEGYNNSENVVAFIEGSELPDEVLIISGHHDHLGIEDGELHMGADDNGSGTVAILEMAEAFKAAEADGHQQ